MTEQIRRSRSCEIVWRLVDGMESHRQVCCWKCKGMRSDGGKETGELTDYVRLFLKEFSKVPRGKQRGTGEKNG